MPLDRPVHRCGQCHRVRVMTALRSFDVPRFWCSFCQRVRVFEPLPPQPAMNRMQRIPRHEESPDAA
jgi:hypothetical protein